MSSQQTPQPNPSQEAPAESFGSTEEAPHGASVSGIGSAGPTMSEVSRHTLAFNKVDPYLYKQFIFQSSFPWTTSDVRGKLLWSMPIHPGSWNKGVAHYTKIYNAWGGGCIVNIKVAGTGFHAGALAFVRFPPNIDPASYAGTYDWSAFEYVIMDPKMLEVATIHIGDQRQIAFHYSVPEDNAPASFSTGGTLACFVYMGLNTSSTGTQQIEALVSTKLAPDFGFSQFRIPRDNQKPVDAFVPDGLERILNFSAETNYSMANTRLTTLEIAPSSIKTFTWGQFTTHLRGDLALDELGLTSGYAYARKGSVAGQITLENTFSNPGFAMCTNLIAYSIPGTTDPVVVPITVLKTTFNSSNLPVLHVSSSTWTALPSDLLTLALRYASIVKEVDGGKWTPPVSESLVYFGMTGDDRTTLGPPQTRAIYEYLRRRSAAGWLRKGMCAVFSIVDTIENVPVGQLKLYEEGYFTARSRPNKLVFRLNRIKLVFNGMLPRNDQLPSNSQENQNALLINYAIQRSLDDLPSQPSE